jgi:dynamin family protein
MLDSAYKAEVVVIGDFSAGKSSFINSLIGKEVCPVNSAATTSSVTKFIFSFDERILNKTDGKTIDAQEYKKLVTHQGNTKTTYELDYYYPFTPLRGVNLYDTPGFANATGQGDTQLTMKKAKEADAALLLVDINTGSVNDALKGKVSELQKANPDMLFYAVLNKADTKSPSARRKVKDEVMKNFDFFKGCYVYSCAPDAEGVDVETAKREIMDDLTRISEAKYKIKTPKFSKDKAEFETDLLSTLKDVKDRLTELAEFNLELKIDDWSEIEEAYEEMADNAVSKCEEKRVLNKGDFDLHILLNEEHFCQEFDGFLNTALDIVAKQCNRQIAFSLQEASIAAQDMFAITEDVLQDFRDVVYDKVYIHMRELLKLDPCRILNIDRWTNQRELYDTKRGMKDNIRRRIIDRFGFLKSEIGFGFENLNSKYQELGNKDKQHYQNTMVKIDDFIAFIKQNEKNRKLNLKEKK